MGWVDFEVWRLVLDLGFGVLSVVRVDFARVAADVISGRLFFGVGWKDLKMGHTDIDLGTIWQGEGNYEL